jgi:hypothetical protein
VLAARSSTAASLADLNPPGIALPPQTLARACHAPNLTIYNQMQGKSEFLITGDLNSWERWDRLHDINMLIATEM